MLLLVEPLLGDRLIFAVTYLTNPEVSTLQKAAPALSEHDIEAHTPQKSRAPEPSTLLLIFSGMMGAVLRFARKSFAKFKRLFDIVLSIFGMAVSLPFVLVAAALIKLTSRGPVIYSQERVGKDGSIFRIYKLRTMYSDAEKGTGAVWAKAHDRRITPVGLALRKTHMDELPQLLNVLRGEMSIVGPRPERPEIVKQLKTKVVDYDKRLQVKPGITGLAQVKHRYDEDIKDVKKKIKYDLLYIKKMCLWVEMRIMAQTFVVALTGKGAR